MNQKFPSRNIILNYFTVLNINMKSLSFSNHSYTLEKLNNIRILRGIWVRFQWIIVFLYIVHTKYVISQFNTKYLQSCNTEWRGPTPPSILGNWFFLISESHSCNKYCQSLFNPRSPCLYVIRFSVSSEQFNWNRPMNNPGKEPWLISTRFPW